MYAYGLDGYTAVIPIKDFVSNNSIIFAPYLYRWKSVKWIYRIELIKDYKDGFWEALGYHPQGDVRLEDRFK